MSRRLVLCGDIGGTKTLLAIAALDGGRLDVVFERRYADRDFAAFADIVRTFHGEARASIEGACLGVAGPIEGRRVAVTNFPWEIDAGALEAILGAPVALANDFVAAAHGIDVLAAGRRRDAPGRRAGAAGAATRDRRGHRDSASPIACGRATVTQWSAARAGTAGLRRRTSGRRASGGRCTPELGRVSVEHVVSGPGLVRIHDFIREGRGDPRSPEEIASGADPVARAAVELFLECYGAAAGDHALAILARGGVFLAGGIAPRILPQLAAGPFLGAFNAKGVHARLAAGFPVQVVLSERLGLLGAAKLAAGL